MDQRLHNALRDTLGAKPVSWEPVQGGYSGYDRYLAMLEDGRRVFVKAAVSEPTADWLRHEWLVYSQACGPYLPVPLGYHDELWPVLVLEDLSGCFTAPPWDEDQVQALRDTLDELADYEPPEEIPSLADELWTRMWDDVAADERLFLSLGLASPSWLSRNLDWIRAASLAAPLEGSALVHADVRSDNVAFKDGAALLVDWSWAARGNPVVDLVSFAVSWASEEGRSPDALVPDDLPGAGEVALVLSGLWAASAGRPAPTHAPNVRALQLRQLKVALPWALKRLGFEPLDLFKAI